MKKKQLIYSAEKLYSVADIMAMLPTEQEAEKYARGSFGYDDHSSYQESAFRQGVDWSRWEIEQKLNQIKN